VFHREGTTFGLGGFLAVLSPQLAFLMTKRRPAKKKDISGKKIHRLKIVTAAPSLEVREGVEASNQEGREAKKKTKEEKRE